MISASMQRRRPGAPSRIQRKTASSSGYTPNFRRPPGSGTGLSTVHGYLHVASRLARVRFSPTERSSSSRTFASSRERMRKDCAFPSNPPMGSAHSLSARLAVVAEGRVAQVVAEARGVDDIGRDAEGDRELTPDLCDLQGMRQAVAREVGCAGGAEHLRLRGEPAQRCGMKHPRAVAGEVVALGTVGLSEEALGGRAHHSRRRAGRPGDQPPLFSISAPRIISEADDASSRDSNHLSGSAVRLG